MRSQRASASLFLFFLCEASDLGLFLLVSLVPCHPWRLWRLSFPSCPSRPVAFGRGCRRSRRARSHSSRSRDVPSRTLELPRPSGDHRSITPPHSDTSQFAYRRTCGFAPKRCRTSYTVFVLRHRVSLILEAGIIGVNLVSLAFQQSTALAHIVHPEILCQRRIFPPHRFATWRRPRCDRRCVGGRSAATRRCTRLRRVPS